MANEAETLKLFVWTDVLANYSGGVMFALAHTVEEAQRVIARDRMDWQDVREIYEKPPEIVTNPKGFLHDGGE
jgi:hypothetical protein